MARALVPALQVLQMLGEFQPALIEWQRLLRADTGEIAAQLAETAADNALLEQRTLRLDFASNFSRASCPLGRGRSMGRAHHALASVATFLESVAGGRGPQSLRSVVANHRMQVVRDIPSTPPLLVADLKA